jgi:hypothetical protein
MKSYEDTVNTDFPCRYKQQTFKVSVNVKTFNFYVSAKRFDSYYSRLQFNNSIVIILA